MRKFLKKKVLYATIAKQIFNPEKPQIMTTRSSVPNHQTEKWEK